jgi:hypothetical protein
MKQLVHWPNKTRTGVGKLSSVLGAKATEAGNASSLDRSAELHRVSIVR